ncbi:MAG: zinc ribbon domain-containing protein [Clostridiales bacterium]|nr:zinc ribbon domain-containing protein [Clostridiales bacterium]
MITCPNCSKQLENTAKFCDACGGKIDGAVLCKTCGKQNEANSTFCKNCGASLSENGIVPEKKISPLKKPPFKLSGKLIAIGSGCIAFVLVAVLVLSALLGGKGHNNYALYIKDREIFLTATSKAKPWQLTDRLIDVGRFDNSDFAEYAEFFGNFIQLSNDGKRIFYIDRLNTSGSSGATLYYRNVKNPDQEPVRIDSEVYYYSVSKSGKLITYIKGEEMSLYQHNLKDKEKIASEIENFEVSDDGKRLYYYNSEGDLYYKQNGKDKEKIDSNISTVFYISDNFNTLYYEKEESLYKKTLGKDKEKIDSDVFSIINIYETGEVYYLKLNSAQTSLLDYITDDMEETDAAMTEPELPQYPSVWDYETNEEFQAAIAQYQTKYDAYQQASAAYYEKQSRDQLREYLAEEAAGTATYSLCYYNGKEKKVLTDDVFFKDKYTYDYVAAELSPVVIYSVCDQDSITKLKLSEIENRYDVKDMVMESLSSSSEKQVAVKDNISVIDQTAAIGFIIDKNGKTVYFFEDVSDETDHGDLYRMSISGGKAQKPELYDSDVYIYITTHTDNGKLVYFKDVANSKGDVYIDKKRIDYDVNLYRYTYLEDSDTLVYITDWNIEKSYGTLKTSRKGKVVKVADDVHSYDIKSGGEILYLKDYSNIYNMGDFFLYRKGKSTKLDDDVVAIIPLPLPENRN